MSAAPTATFLGELSVIGGADYGNAVACPGKILQTGIDLIYLNASAGDVKRPPDASLMAGIGDDYDFFGFDKSLQGCFNIPHGKSGGGNIIVVRIEGQQKKNSRRVRRFRRMDKKTRVVYFIDEYKVLISSICSVVSATGVPICRARK